MDQLIYDYFYLKVNDSTIINLIKQQPQLRDQLLQRIPIVLSQMPIYFPTTGVVSKINNYNYIKLNDNNNYIVAISKLLNAIEYGYGFDKLVMNKSLLQYKLKIVAPPSPIGSHVTIGNNNLINQKVSFTLTNLTSYYDQGQGYRVSGFDSNLYIIKWYVIYVNGLPTELTKNYNDIPHISVGVLSYNK